MTEQNTSDQYSIDLLNGGIDGELSTSQQGELESLLAGSGKLRGLNDELRVLTGVLDELPEVDPPAYLQDSIEKQIRLPVQSTSKEAKAGFFGTWLPAHWLRTGFALTAGAVLTVAVYEMGSKPISAEDARQLAGTVVKHSSSSQGNLIDSIDISGETLSGTVKLMSNDNIFTLDVQLNSDGPTEMVVDFAGKGLEFGGITRMQDRQDAVSVLDGKINISSTGEQHYTMTLVPSKEFQEQTLTGLELEFFANHLLVHEAVLNISQ